MSQATRLLTLASLRALGINLSRFTIRRLVLAGRFPPPLKIGLHRIAWREDQVTDWLANRPTATPKKSKK